MEYYSVKEFRKELSSYGINTTEKAIRHYIAEGKIFAQKEILRPRRWQIPSSEINRIVNIG